MGKLSIVVSCLILICVASVAMAMPATTLQTWNFSTSVNPALPECCSNAYGDPNATLYTTGNPASFMWWDSAYGRLGVWAGEPLGITLTIPNRIEPDEYKEIWLEMDFMSTLEWIQVTPSYETSGEAGLIEEISRDISPVDDYWSKLIIGWRIEPNPVSETICMSLTGTGGFVDSITVETACVPEPATLTLLGLGAMVLVKIKRK